MTAPVRDFYPYPLLRTSFDMTPQTDRERQMLEVINDLINSVHQLHTVIKNVCDENGMNFPEDYLT